MIGGKLEKCFLHRVHQCICMFILIAGPKKKSPPKKSPPKEVEEAIEPEEAPKAKTSPPKDVSKIPFQIDIKNLKTVKAFNSSLLIL